MGIRKNSYNFRRKRDFWRGGSLDEIIHRGCHALILQVKQLFENVDNDYVVLLKVGCDNKHSKFG